LISQTHPASAKAASVREKDSSLKVPFPSKERRIRRRKRNCCVFDKIKNTVKEIAEKLESIFFGAVKTN